MARAHSYGEVKAGVVAGMFVELKCSSLGVETLKHKLVQDVNTSTIHILSDTVSESLRTPGWTLRRLVLSTPLTLFAWLHARVRPSIVHTCT